MVMMFVVWEGDRTIDPLNYGCQFFPGEARQMAGFIETQLNKGYRVFVYRGEQIKYTGCVYPE